MAGSKRSSRLATRKAKPKYADGASSNDEGQSESEFSGVTSEDDSPVKPVGRRGKIDRSRRRRSSASAASEKSNDSVGKNEDKPSRAGKDSKGQQSKIKAVASYSTRADKKTSSPPGEGEGGSDHAEDGDAKTTRPGKRSRPLSEGGESESVDGNKKSKLGDEENGKLPPPASRSKDDSSGPLDDMKDEGKDPPQCRGENEGGSEGVEGRKKDGGSSSPVSGVKEKDAASCSKDPDPIGANAGEKLEGNNVGSPGKPKEKNSETQSLSQTPEMSGGENGLKESGDGDATKCDDAAIEKSKGSEAEVAPIPPKADSKEQTTKANDAPERGNDHQAMDDAPSQAAGHGEDESKDGNDLAEGGGISDGPKGSEPPAGDGSSSDVKSGIGLAGKGPDVDMPDGTNGKENDSKKAPSGNVHSNIEGRMDASRGDQSDLAKTKTGCSVDVEMGDEVNGKEHDSEQRPPVKPTPMKIESRGDAENNDTVPACGKRKADPVVSNERIRVVSDEPGECQSSPEIHVGDSKEGCVSKSSVPAETVVPSSPQTTTSASSPETAKRKRQAKQQHSVGQLKMALFLEASKVHRGNGPERAFAKYWENLERYIRSGPNGAVRSDASASCAGMEATLQGFLRTGRMRRLHNRLVLAIMTEAMRTDVPVRCISKMPRRWQTKAKAKAKQSVVKEDVIAGKEDVAVEVSRRPDLQSWDAVLGPRSGVWTACGNEVTIDDSNLVDPLHANYSGSIDDYDRDVACPDDDVLPPARLPGALEIEPLVRRRAAASGLAGGASENAIWMLAVAVRRYSAALVERVVANDKELEGGYASELPGSYGNSLACARFVRENDLSEDRKGRSTNGHKEKDARRRVLTTASLSNVLASKTSAGSRLASMRSAIASDRQKLSSQTDLDRVNELVNASIELAAHRREESCPKPQKAVRAPSSRKQPAATAPLKMPQSSPRVGQPMRPPPQSQITQPPNSGQMMSHSNHIRGAIAGVQQQNQPQNQPVPIPKAMPSSEPLTKPGFPGITNSGSSSPAKIPEPTKNAAKGQEKSKTPSPPPRSVRRGSKNLAAMMNRPKPSSSNTTTSEGDKKGSVADAEKKGANGAAPAAGSSSNSGDAKKKEEGDDKKDEKEEDASKGGGSRPPSTGPPRPRGRGFGVKNLAAMRARASFTESGK